MFNALNMFSHSILIIQRKESFKNYWQIVLKKNLFHKNLLSKEIFWSNFFLRWSKWMNYIIWVRNLTDLLSAYLFLTSKLQRKSQSRWRFYQVMGKIYEIWVVGIISCSYFSNKPFLEDFKISIKILIEISKFKKDILFLFV